MGRDRTGRARIATLAGGVGAARFLRGLARIRGFQSQLQKPNACDVYDVTDGKQATWGFVP